MNNVVSTQTTLEKGLSQNRIGKLGLVDYVNLSHDMSQLLEGLKTGIGYGLGGF